MGFALVTPSYGADLERCQLLCQSIDRYLSGFDAHYVLVDSADRSSFEPLLSARRHLLDDQQLLPGLFQSTLTPQGRLYRSRLVPLTLTGWHMQQLRKLAAVNYFSHEVMLSLDSDTVVVKPTHLSELFHPEKVPLYGLRRGIKPQMRYHQAWSLQMAKVLGLGTASDTDYISSVMFWRKKSVAALLAHLERVNQMPWHLALGANPYLSECLLYGRFVQDCQQLAGHQWTTRPFCHMYWDMAPLENHQIQQWVKGLSQSQFAVGFQSRSHTSLPLIRQATGFNCSPDI